MNQPRYGAGGVVGRRMVEEPFAKAMTMTGSTGMAPPMMASGSMPSSMSTATMLPPSAMDPGVMGISKAITWGPAKAPRSKAIMRAVESAKKQAARDAERKPVSKGAGEPEARRQRRLSSAATVTAGTGAASAAWGGRGVRRDTRGARRFAGDDHSAIRPREGNETGQVIEDSYRARKELQSGRSLVLSRGNAARLAAGIGGIGAGIGIARHARNSEKWY